MILSDIGTLPATGLTDAVHDEPVDGRVIITEVSELEGNAFPTTLDPSQSSTPSTSSMIYSSLKQRTPQTNQSNRWGTPVGKGPNHLSEICDAVDAIRVELCTDKENYSTLENRIGALETQKSDQWTEFIHQKL